MRLIKRPPSILPSVHPRDRHKLPSTAGIYYCVQHGQIAYIGRAVDLENRWRDHHKQRYLNGHGWKIHYRTMPQWLINGREAEEIDRYRPRLNERGETPPAWWFFVVAIDTVIDAAVTLVGCVFLFYLLRGAIGG